MNNNDQLVELIDLINRTRDLRSDILCGEITENNSLSLEIRTALANLELVQIALENAKSKL